MIRLKNWYLTRHKDRSDGEPYYIAHGTVFGHPSIADDTKIRTSILKNILEDAEQNRLILRTSSDHEYVALLSDVNQTRFEQTQICLQESGISSGTLETCHNNKYEKDSELFSKLDDVLKKNELYLIWKHGFVQKAIFKNSARELREIPVTPHIGTFSDSYLITDFEHDEVDFRYIDQDMVIQPYSWEDRLRTVYLENLDNRDVIVKYADSIACIPGTVTRVSKNKKRIGKKDLSG